MLNSNLETLAAPHLRSRIRVEIGAVTRDIKCKSYIRTTKAPLQ